MGISELTPYLRVADLARSIAFYTDGLGFTVTDRMVDDGRTVWARLASGGASIMLSAGGARSLEHSDDDDHVHAPFPGPRQSDGIDVHTATWLYTDDVDAAHARLVAAGADVVEAPQEQPYGLRDFLVRDPDGYHYVVGQRTG